MWSGGTTGLKQKGKNILMVGACGMGMAPLSIFLSAQGDTVWAIDDYPVPSIQERLRRAGVQILAHLHGDHLYDEVILSRAIAYDPARVAALNMQFPTADFYYRGDYLSRIAATHPTVVVAGSHGKTTTTATLIHLLKGEGHRISYILGGFFEKDRYAAAEFDQEADWLILEVDESDRTIESFSPDVLLVTNVELDHVDAYADESAIRTVFCNLVSRTKICAFVDGNWCDSDSLDTTAGAEIRHLEQSPTDHFDSENASYAQQVAAYLVGGKLKSRMDAESFHISIERRQEVTQISENTLIVQDYAHHPTELRALLKWIAQRFPGYDTQVVFQPHRYSRTKALKQEFVNALLGNQCYLIPEYGAFEHRESEGTSRSLFEALGQKMEQARYLETPVELAEILGVESTGKRVIVFAGAGDIPLWAKWVETSLTIDNAATPSIWTRFHERLCGQESKFSCSEPLKRKLTLNVGGTARYYAEPDSLYTLQMLLKSSKMLGLPVQIIGKGSNLLADDGEFEGVVIRLSHAYWRYCEYLGDGRFWARAGAVVKMICRDAVNEGVDGFSFMEGIPGSIGGAVHMNAGAVGCETGERVVEIECLDRDGKVKRFTREELRFSYRHCEEVADLVMTAVLLQGKAGYSPEALTDQIVRERTRRFETQPAEASAGCMFKNPNGDFAGRLIENAGLKGYRIGGARISEKHANFLVTEKGASASDVSALMEHVKTRIRELHGVELEQEIKHFRMRGNC